MGTPLPPEKGQITDQFWHMYCNQTAERIKMPIGTGIGFGRGHNGLDGTHPLPQIGTHPNLRPMSVVAERWTDQDATLYGGRPRPWSHCVRWGPTQGARPCQFSAMLLCPNVWMDQDATWYEGRPRPKRYCVNLGIQLP